MEEGWKKDGRRRKEGGRKEEEGGGLEMPSFTLKSTSLRIGGWMGSVLKFVRSELEMEMEMALWKWLPNWK